jgi:transcription elongation factor Elf1
MVSNLSKKINKENNTIICKICEKPIKLNLAIYYLNAQPVFVCNQCHLKLPTKIKKLSTFRKISNKAIPSI